MMASGYELLTHNERGGLAAACADFSSDGTTAVLLFASFINPHDICYMAINDFARTGRPIVTNEARDSASSFWTRPARARPVHSSASTARRFRTTTAFPSWSRTDSHRLRGRANVPAIRTRKMSDQSGDCTAGSIAG